jgi:hypothetical protein
MGSRYEGKKYKTYEIIQKDKMKNLYKNKKLKDS